MNPNPASIETSAPQVLPLPAPDCTYIADAVIRSIDCLGADRLAAEGLDRDVRNIVGEIFAE